MPPVSELACAIFLAVCPSRTDLGLHEAMLYRPRIAATSGDELASRGFVLWHRKCGFLGQVFRYRI